MTKEGLHRRVERAGEAGPRQVAHRVVGGVAGREQVARREVGAGAVVEGAAGVFGVGHCGVYIREL